MVPGQRLIEDNPSFCLPYWEGQASEVYLNSLVTLEGQLEDLVAVVQTKSRADLRAGHQCVAPSSPG